MLEDILEESWTFQEIRQQSLEKGLTEGLKEGLKEGLAEGRKEARGQMLQGQRQTLILLIQAHYSALLQLAQDACNTIQTPEELQDLLQKVLLAKDELEVHQHLLSAKK